MTRFAAMYEGKPAWDIGRPQGAFIGLELAGPLLDVGCGTGENALHFAARGLEVVGIDLVPFAIDRARAKARERGLAATFQIGDALELDRLGRRFATAIDSGVFHVFDDAERGRYVDSLGRALDPGGRYVMLVFNDREPMGWGGPRRVRRDEIEATFTIERGWAIRSIAEARLETTIHPNGGLGWLATVDRLRSESEP